jgi:hypothetical protein
VIETAGSKIGIENTTTVNKGEGGEIRVQRTGRTYENTDFHTGKMVSAYVLGAASLKAV